MISTILASRNLKGRRNKKKFNRKIGLVSKQNSCNSEKFMKKTIKNSMQSIGKNLES